MAMNALSLYVTTCRMIFQTDVETNGSHSTQPWADNIITGKARDINRLVLYLRQALTCCVCGKLLTVPMSSTVSSCQHHVCKGCVGGKMRLKPSCSWCKDHSKFIENTQLRILLQCYKRLCEFMMSASMHLKWGDLTSGSASGTNMSFAELVLEGAQLHDRYNFAEPPSLRGYSRSTSSNARVTTNTLTTNAYTAQNGLIVTNSLNSSNSGKKSKIKKYCRCGLATRNPGKLTCCGQRCPCYVDGKGCFDCKCRGCRNPHKANNNNVTVSSKSSLQPPSVPVTVSVISGISPTLTSSISGTLSPSLSTGSSLLPISSTLRTINIVSSPGSTSDTLLPFPKLEDSIVSDVDIDTC